MEFRTFGPESDYPVEEFIENHVNLMKFHATEVHVPEGLGMLLAQQDLAEEERWTWQRHAVLRGFSDLAECGDHLIHSDDEGDFTFESMIIGHEGKLPWRNAHRRDPKLLKEQKKVKVL